MEWFIQIHRQMLEWEWYDDINTKVLFIHLLIKANWSDKQWRWIDIKRWELLTGRIVLAEETWLTQQQIRTSLDKLKLTNEITIKPTNKYSIIKLTNYNSYQWDNQQTTEQVTNNQPTSNQQVTTTNNINKNNKINNILDTDIVITPKVVTKNLQELIKDTFDTNFINDLNNKYNLAQEDFKEQCNLFYNHWSEKNPNWKKEKWQMEKTFDPKLRFYKWLSNNKKWSLKEKTKISNITF